MDSSRSIVIAGASSGIGAALAVQLGQQGHRVVLAARRETELAAVARRAGSRAVAVRADVTVRTDVERLRDQALQAFGEVDVWVNLAGRAIGRHVLDLTDEELDAMITSNVKSALYAMQAIVPHFIERERGHLINVSSFLGRVPLAPHRSAYSAAKAALNVLTANLRMDLRRSHPAIHVSLLIPGQVDTDFARKSLGDAIATPPGPIPPQPVEEVAAALVRLIEHPVAEMYTETAQASRVLRYYEDVDAFEQNVG